MSNAPLLEARELRCVRDRRVLFDALNFTLSAGELMTLEGANGSGKTSLLRLLCGLLPARGGDVLWRGELLADCRPLYYAELLFIGHSPGVKLDLSPYENLRFAQRLGGHDGDAETDVDTALAEVGLEGFEDVPARTLSAGQRRRVALARLWLSNASLWLLDEPLTALDAAAIAALERRLRRHADAGGAALFSSHQPLSVGTTTRLAL